MAEKEVSKSESKKSNVKPQADKIQSREVVKENKKKTWTLALCKKYAHRYSNEMLWKSGHSSSYKSAVSHGWLAECLSYQNTKTSTVTKKAA